MMEARTSTEERRPRGVPHRIIQEPEDGSECPFCHKHVASRGYRGISCTGCGVGIPHPQLAPKAMTTERRTLYFCCIWCLRIYRRDHEITPQVARTI